MLALDFFLSFHGKYIEVGADFLLQFFHKYAYINLYYYSIISGSSLRITQHYKL